MSNNPFSYTSFVDEKSILKSADGAHQNDVSLTSTQASTLLKSKRNKKDKDDAENPFSFRLFLDDKEVNEESSIKSDPLSAGHFSLVPEPPEFNPDDLPTIIIPEFPELCSIIPDEPPTLSVSLDFLPHEMNNAGSVPIPPPPDLPQMPISSQVFHKNDNTAFLQIQLLNSELAKKNAEIQQLKQQLKEQQLRESQETEEMNAVVLQVENNLLVANERRTKVEAENRRLRDELTRLKAKMGSKDSVCEMCSACGLLQSQSLRIGEQIEVTCSDVEGKLKELMHCCRILKVQGQQMQSVGVFESADD